MRVFLVYAYVSSLEDRHMYTHTPCNRLSRDNTRVLNKLDLTQISLSITVSLVLSDITLPTKHTTIPTIENQLCRLRRLTTTKPLRSQKSSQIQVTIYAFSRGHYESILRNSLLWYILTYLRTLELSCVHIYPNLCTRMHTHTYIHSNRHRVGICFAYMATYQYSD